jgi:putative transposase
MSFTMKYTAHPKRKTSFTQAVEASGRIHALVAKGKPWRNGFIERSNRTDKEEVFTQFRFANSEERKYQLKLWEMEYNNLRPHQGLNNQIPFQVYRREYPIHLATRAIT